ncbi:MAG: arginine deiminase family protein [Gemmatimonadota bacterium]
MYRFEQALLREPSASCVRGLRAVDRGAPDPVRFVDQHRAYALALETAGLGVTVLAPDELHPDSVFVEDPALCLHEAAVLLRPAAVTRAGETVGLLPALHALYGRAVERVVEGTIEGGDILVLEEEILIGLSARTNARGAASLTHVLAPLGYQVRVTEVPAGVLHLKSDCATLGDGHVLATRRLAASGVFDGYEVIEVPQGEETGANAVRVNDRVLLARGYPRTAERLTAAGYAVVELDISEAQKLDGGLSCMSLRKPHPR